MGFDEEQRMIVLWSALAILLIVVVLGAGYYWMPPSLLGFPETLALADRIAFALKWDLPISCGSRDACAPSPASGFGTRRTGRARLTAADASARNSGGHPAELAGADGDSIGCSPDPSDGPARSRVGPHSAACPPLSSWPSCVRVPLRQGRGRAIIRHEPDRRRGNHGLRYRDQPHRSGALTSHSGERRDYEPARQRACTTLNSRICTLSTAPGRRPCPAALLAASKKLLIL